MYEAIPVFAKAGGRSNNVNVQQQFPRMLRWHVESCNHWDYGQLEIEIQAAGVRLKD